MLSAYRVSADAALYTCCHVLVAPKFPEALILTRYIWYIAGVSAVTPQVPFEYPAII